MIDLTRNWAGNQVFQSHQVHRPRDLGELQRLVASSDRVKAIGTRHSFTTIADTPGQMISMENFNTIIGIDEAHQAVTVGAGMPYGSFCAGLNAAGFAVHNMASLPQITVGGACATATHGSGDNNGNLATAVSALELVTADGDLVRLSREKDRSEFPGVVVGLGGFGVVTALTLDIRPTYSVRQDIYENLPVSALDDHFNEIMALGYSVSLFTDWQGEHVNQVWIKRLNPDDEPATVSDQVFGAQLAEVRHHPSPGKSVDDCTDQLGAVGPWHERLPHFRVDSIGPSGDELQTEYFVSRAHATSALREIVGIQGLLAPVIKTSEIRTVAADDLWMSPSYESACVGIHFTWRPDWPTVQAILPIIEERLEPYSPRPHWGKLFSIAPENVAARYPRFEDFRALLHDYDPEGKFRNAFLDEYIPRQH